MILPFTNLDWMRPDEDAFSDVYTLLVLFYLKTPLFLQAWMEQILKIVRSFLPKKKLAEVAEYIKRNALAWHISWIDADEIDKTNILESTMKGMHDCIDNMFKKLEGGPNKLPQCMAIVDGNYFKPYTRFDQTTSAIVGLPHVTIEQGDANYMSIAAASILAKNARDEWVLEMCQQYPVLVERYGLDTNMGYGTKRHLDGIREHGISEWHRRTFGDLCKGAATNLVSEKH
jgi:ribonuclease HII